MAGKKLTQKNQDSSNTKFEETPILPKYTNNARIKVTSDNVFIDFGFQDPFSDPEESKSEVVARIVMNHSTFETFTKHLNITNTGIQKGGKTPEIPIVIMSRCPPKVDPKI